MSASISAHFAEILEHPEEQFIALPIQDSFEHDGIHMFVEVKAA